MLSSKFLKDIMTEAYPIIKRQLEDAEVIASFRDLVTANGGDWSALKALMKAHVQDSLDDSGEGKRVKKILDKADSSNAYAGLLGLANMNENNYFPGDDDEAEETETQPLNQAGPDVGPSSSSAAAEGRVVTSLAGAEGIVDRQPITQPHPTKADGSDLTTSPGPHGQVADIQRDDAAQTETAKASAPEPAESEAVDISVPVPDAGKSVEAPASAAPAPVAQPQRATTETSTVEKGVTGGESAATPPMYAAPGVVTWETAPPEGVVHHEYSKAFGTLGQDIAVIEEDLKNAAAEPIVKVGNFIIDGWARFNKARSMYTDELRDGVMVRVHLEYPVKQYDGTDPLIDVIRWNMSGRILNEEQRRLIAKRLVSIEPHRKAEIFKALDMGMELVGA